MCPGEIPQTTVIMSTHIQPTATPFPWNKWNQLPQVEREAELNEAHKEAVMKEAELEHQHQHLPTKSDSTISEISNAGDAAPLNASDVHAAGFIPTDVRGVPYWEMSEGAVSHAPGADPDGELTPDAGALGGTAAASQAVGHHGSPHPVEPDFGQAGESILRESGMDGLRESGMDDLRESGMDGLRESGMDGLRESGMDGLRESDPQTAAADSLTGEADESTGNFTRTVREFFGQSDSVTGNALANADTDSSPSWFHMHHDDGIMDAYLDVGADASGFDSFLLQSGSDLIAPIAEPFADAAAITDLMTGKSSPMEAVADPLVAAGPLDAVQVDEPRNNDF